MTRRDATGLLERVGTVARDDWPTPLDAPRDDTRSTVKAWRRDVADWLRAHGMTASGAVWQSAMCGERDLTTLRIIAASDPDGATLARHWAGYVMPAALADGDMTADYGRVSGQAMRDPETGHVWICTRDMRHGYDHDVTVTDVTITDHEITDVSRPVYVTRGKGDLTAR